MRAFVTGYTPGKNSKKCQSAVRREGILKEFLPGVYPVTNARAWGIYYYYKDWPTWLKELSIYFYEVTRTRTPPYCFEYMIALVKADNFTIDIQSSNRNSTSVSQRAVIGGFTLCWFYAHRRVFVHCAFPVFIILLSCGILIWCFTYQFIRDEVLWQFSKVKTFFSDFISSL